MIEEGPPGCAALSSPLCGMTVKAQLRLVCSIFGLIGRVAMVTLKRSLRGGLGLSVAEVFIELETEAGEAAGRHL